jgi:hypothetical protein
MFSLSNVEVAQLKDTRFLITYFLGFLIIVMFAKDKFNMPIFDKQTIGPFAQLPPQFLTIDSRYQFGRVVYIALLVSLYTAICIIGPTTFNFDVGAAVTQTGIASSAQIWPVAAATFLVSTGAAKDDWLLGRIELSIRQYAHKTAYIPTAVNDLAFSLRNHRVNLWLIQNPYIDEDKFAERKAAFARLVGSETVKKFEENPGQEGEFTAWLRANILFFSLQQIFSKGPGISNPRLDNLTDQQENLDIFERLKNKQKTLVAQFSILKNQEGINQEGSGLDQAHAEVQRFARETSLAIAVLLSRSAKNASELTQLLTQLGFPDVYPRNRSDHFVYNFLVNIFIFFGVVLTCLLLVAPVVTPTLFKFVNWTNEDLARGFVIVITSFLIYVVMFRVLDYSRDKLLEMQDWQENLVSYARTVLSSSVLTSAISIVIATLFLTFFSLLSFIAGTPTDLISHIIFQTLLAALGTTFGLFYMRQAGRFPRAHLKLARNLLNGTALLHACLAAVLVGLISLFAYTQQISRQPRDAFRSATENFSAIKPTMIKGTNSHIYSFYTPADANFIDNKLKEVDGLWTGQLYGTKQMSDQQTTLGEICKRLNSKFKFKEVEVEGSDDVLELFKIPEKCLGHDVTAPSKASDSEHMPKSQQKADQPQTDAVKLAEVTKAKLEGQFFTFVVYLSQLYQRIDALRPENRWSKAVYVYCIFPMIVAFILAYSFGVGCRFWRAWWLYNEVDRSDGNGQKLLEQIKKTYGDQVDFDRCLVLPIPSLGNVTALEALRYEDYRVKLFTKIQKQQIDWTATSAVR